MAVHQQHGANIAQNLVQQGVQRAVVGAVDGFNPRQGIGEAQAFAVDFFAFGHKPGDGAKAARHAGRTGIHVARQFAGEHAGIKFIGLAVEVDIGARHQGAQQRCAVVDAAHEQFIDVAVFRFAERCVGKPGHAQEIGGVLLATMGRIENSRRRPRAGRQDLKK